MVWVQELGFGDCLGARGIRDRAWVYRSWFGVIAIWFLGFSAQGVCLGSKV